MRRLLMALLLFTGPITAAQAQVSVRIGLPGVQIGVNVPVYPELVPVPGYPVYYDPRASSNYFFYDGMYWVFQHDNWYASSWYNGPWYLVEPARVPLFVLRIPVRYYRYPPPYFRGWHADGPPRWGERWGHDWDDHHRGWDRWDRGSAPRPAPLPLYQRRYAGDRYPHAEEQQRAIRQQQYGYQPREIETRHHYDVPPRPAPPGRAEPWQAPRQGPPDRRHEDRQGPPERRHEGRPGPPEGHQEGRPPQRDRDRDRDR